MNPIPQLLFLLANWLHVVGAIEARNTRDSEVTHDSELKLKRTAQSTKMEANADNVCGTLSRASAWVEAGRAGFVGITGIHTVGNPV